MNRRFQYKIWKLYTIFYKRGYYEKESSKAKFNRLTDFLLQVLVKKKAKNKGIYGFVKDNI